MKIIGYAILVTACLCAGQTSAEFHSRYGESDTERFKIRDGIGLTVLYGSDGLACQMEVKPQTLLVQRPQQKLMAPEVVDGIIDEVVPPDTRGKKVDSMLQQTGCSRYVVDYYEGVRIGRGTDACRPLKPERDKQCQHCLQETSVPRRWLADCGRGCGPLPEGDSGGEGTTMQRCTHDIPDTYQHLPNIGIRRQSDNDSEKVPNRRL